MQANSFGKCNAIASVGSALADQALFNDFCQMHKEFLPICQIWPERNDATQLAEDIGARLT
jgi:hypothetical protein